MWPSPPNGGRRSPQVKLVQPLSVLLGGLREGGIESSSLERKKLRNDPGPRVGLAVDLLDAVTAFGMHGVAGMLFLVGAASSPDVCSAPCAGSPVRAAGCG